MGQIVTRKRFYILLGQLMKKIERFWEKRDGWQLQHNRTCALPPTKISFWQMITFWHHTGNQITEPGSLLFDVVSFVIKLGHNLASIVLFLLITRRIYSHHYYSLSNSRWSRSSREFTVGFLDNGHSNGTSVSLRSFVMITLHNYRHEFTQEEK